MSKIIELKIEGQERFVEIINSMKEPILVRLDKRCLCEKEKIGIIAVSGCVIHTIDIDSNEFLIELLLNIINNCNDVLVQNLEIESNGKDSN